MYNFFLKVPYDEDLLLCHRIVSINGSRIFTKGDANKNDDSWILQNGFPYENVQGKVFFRVPQLGLPILVIRETWIGKVHKYYTAVQCAGNDFNPPKFTIQTTLLISRSQKITRLMRRD